MSQQQQPKKQKEFKSLNRQGFIGKFKWPILILLLVGAYILVHVAIPYSDAYYAKAILKRTCNEAMRDILNNVPDDKAKWPAKMLGSLKMHNIKVNEDQWSLTAVDIDGKKQRFKCDAEIAFKMVSDWGIAQDIKPDLKPLVTKHRYKVHVDWNR